MTRVELVLAKGASVRRRLDRIADALSVGRDTFVGDVGRIERAAFNVFLAMQECVDIGAHVVADERWGAPATLGEVFDVLKERGVLTDATASAMRRGARLRNLGEIGAFLAEVEKWLPAA